MREKQCPSRQTEALLARWRGAQARLWHYAITHKTLTIRLEAEYKEGNLHVIVHDTHVVQMPTVWFDAQLELIDAGRDRFGDPMTLVIDRRAGVRILGYAVELQENVEPLMKVIYPKDHAPVLDHYMKVWTEYTV